eukprot:scaffold2797_cov234-Pinguiococcus_pyrenoidosus.AAC.2
MRDRSKHEVDAPRPRNGGVKGSDAVRGDEEDEIPLPPKIVQLRQHGRRQPATFHGDAFRLPIRAELLDLVEEDDRALEGLQSAEGVLQLRRDVRDAGLEEVARRDGHKVPAKKICHALRDRRLCSPRGPKENGTGNAKHFEIRRTGQQRSGSVALLSLAPVLGRRPRRRQHRARRHGRWQEASTSAAQAQEGGSIGRLPDCQGIQHVLLQHSLQRRRSAEVQISVHELIPGHLAGRVDALRVELLEHDLLEESTDHIPQPGDAHHHGRRRPRHRPPAIVEVQVVGAPAAEHGAAGRRRRVQPADFGLHDGRGEVGFCPGQALAQLRHEGPQQLDVVSKGLQQTGQHVEGEDVAVAQVLGPAAVDGRPLGPQAIGALLRKEDLQRLLHDATVRRAVRPPRHLLDREQRVRQGHRVEIPHCTS